MEKLVIKKNKLKFYIYFSISVLIVLFSCCISMKGLLYPSSYIFWFMPTKEIVFTIAIFGIIVSVLGFILIIITFFNKKYYIEINEIGIFLGMLPFNKKFLKWSEINDISEKTFNNNKYLLFFTTHRFSENDESYLNKIFIRINFLTHGTPYIISSNLIESDFAELKDVIIINWKKHKEPNQ